MPRRARPNADRHAHDPAYTLLRQLMEAAGGTLGSLEAALGATGVPYSYDAIAAWGRPGRRVPRDPALLLTIVEALAATGPLPATLTL
jgi:uncharacterized membrane protein YdfJ with MMPL/SSD domain